MTTPHLDAYRQLEGALAAYIAPQRLARGLRLERIIALLQRLDNPHYKFAAIHVGGTAGKGSTATVAAAILTAAGYKTGLHVSPHLQLVNERHQIDGRLTPTSRLRHLLDEMRPAIAAATADQPWGEPSYFEVQVALAFLNFARAGVDIAVIEVGLGGTLDATNVLPADVAVLTNVGLDHTAILGDTVEAIAADKAGIIKPGQVVVSGVKQLSVWKIVAERCREQSASLWQMGLDFSYAWEADGRLTIRLPERDLESLTVGLPGTFQGGNVALAVAAVARLTEWPVDDTAVARGVAAARLPGRMEVVQERPTVLLDGAHNPDKIAAAVSAITERPKAGRRLVVLALKADKAAADILAALAPVVDHLFLTTFRIGGLWTAADPEALAAVATAVLPGVPLTIEADPDAALDAARQMATAGDLIWVTGSLYLVGNLRERWHPIEALLAAAEEADG